MKPIKIREDGIVEWDGKRFVGSIPWGGDRLLIEAPEEEEKPPTKKKRVSVKVTINERN